MLDKRNILKRYDFNVRDRLDALSDFQVEREFAAICEFLGVPMRQDGADPIRRVLKWNGLEIGVTHEPGDVRFGRFMSAGYGHVRRSYGKAPDGKALDIYIGNNLESSNFYKVRQLHPETGEPDEDKWFVGYSEPAEVRKAFIYHAGSDRFGGVTPCDPKELDEYRADDCSRPSDAVRLRAGTKALTSMQKQAIANLPVNPDNALAIVREILESGFPDEIVGIQDLSQSDRGITGEFIAPMGRYGFSIQKGYWGYGWRGDARQPSAPHQRDDAEGDDEEDEAAQIVAQLTRKTTSELSGWVNVVDDFIENFSGSLEELRDRLSDLYPKTSKAKFARMMKEARLLSYLAARSAVIEESSNE